MQPIQPPSSPHTYIPSQSPTEQFHNFSAHQIPQHQGIQQQQGQQQQVAGGQQQQTVYITPLYVQQGSDGYVASPSAGFSAPQSGPPHQGPPAAVLRGMQSTPPTPPQQDLNKMQQPTQSMYAPPGTTNTSGNVRPSQQTNIFRNAAPNSAQRGGPRHNLSTIPPMYPQQLQSMVMPYQFAPRQAAPQIFSGSHSYHFPQPQLANYSFPIYYPLSTQHRPNAVPGGIVQTPSGPTLGPTTTQNPIALQSGSVLTPSGQTGSDNTSGTGSTTGKRTAKNRPNAIPIVDPKTQKNILEDYEQAQSTPSTDLEYQDHVSMGTGDILSVGSQQSSDQLGMNSDPSCSNKTIQGMAYVDIMPHHKLSHMPPFQSGFNQVNETIGPTPIASAMSDAPLVEIHPKQQTKKKSKPIEIVAAPTVSPTVVEKPSDCKNQAPVNPESIGEDISELAKISESNTCSFSSAQPAEESADSKAIQNRVDSETESSAGKQKISAAVDTNELGNLSEHHTEGKGNFINSPTVSAATSTSNSNSNISSGGYQQKQQSQSTLTPSLSSAPLSTTAATLPPISGSSASLNSKRDSTSKAPSTLPPLPHTVVGTSSTTNQSSAPTVSSSGSSNTGSIAQVGKADKQSVVNSSSSSNSTLGSSPPPSSSLPLTGPNPKPAGASSSISVNSSNVASTTGKQNKSKDKHQQQQQPPTGGAGGGGGSAAAAAAVAATGAGAPAVAAVGNNNNSPTAAVVGQNLGVEETKVQSKQNSINNNNAQSKQSDKMKLEKQDDKVDHHQHQKVNSSSNASSNLSMSGGTDRRDAANNLNNTSTSNKINSDSNENIMPSKTYPADEGTCPALTDTGMNLHTRERDSNAQLATSTASSPKPSSRDETDKAATVIPDDNLNYYKKPNNNNNNEKIVSAEGVQPSSKSKAIGGAIEDDTEAPLNDSSPPAIAPEDDSVDRCEEAEISAPDESSTTTTIANGHGDDEKADPQAGTITYDRSQLIALRDTPSAKAMPDVSSSKAPPHIFVTQNRSPQPSLMPSFAQNNKRGQAMGSRNLSIGGGMSGSQNAGSFHKQASMSGVNAKNSSKGSKSGMIHVSLSLREDVKLNETENAWRPTHLKNDASKPPEEVEHEELLRRVRGILNKLTPEKFETLVDQIFKLQIDSPKKLNGVMELVFEKAVDEPNFSVSYARLCQRLGDIKITSEEGKTFKSALIDKTENEFSNNVLNRKAKEEKLQPIMEKIKECADGEKKLELQAILEDGERKIRRRSGGTVRFIGELFKINMLTGNIIYTCIESLLDASSEDKLECLCKLLETVGKKLETTPPATKEPQKQQPRSLETVVKKMQTIADRKANTKISSRVRFMLQDVIDLRKNKWMSSRVDLNPKTMEQIQKEAKNEQINSQYLNYNMASNKKDDRRYPGGGGGGGGGGSGGNSMSFGGGGGGGGYFNKGNRQAQGDDVWYTQTGKGRAVDTSKLGMLTNSANIDQETRLGGSSQFIWPSYGGMRQQTSTPIATTANSFAALSSLDSNKNSNSGPRNKGSYNKGSMERDRYDGVHSRTGSAHGSRESSSSRNPISRGSSNVQKSTSYQNYNSSVPTASRPTKTGSSSTSSPSTIQMPSAPPPAVFDDLGSNPERPMISALDEMVENVLDNKMDECILILKKFPEGKRWGLLYYTFCEYLHLGNVKPMHRRILARVFLFLINRNFISLEHLKKGYRDFCELAADTVIDVPEAWNYIFQFMVPLIHKKLVTIKDLWNDTLKETEQQEKFLKNLILQCTREIGPNYMRNLWTSNNMKWSDFFDKKEAEDKFIKDNQFEFIESKDAKPPLPTNPAVDKIMDRVKELLTDGAITDAIIDYISGNTTDINKAFIRGLTTTLCNYAIQNKRNLDQKRFQQICIPPLQRYIDSHEDRELECLYAIQVLVNNLEHPSGLLSELFGELYDAYVIPQDAFLKWHDSKEEPAGKGVAVKGLTRFFSNLSSGDTSDENN